jgi:hypothetical protein
MKLLIQFLLIFFLFPLASVIRRHDLPDAIYLKGGQDQKFLSVGQIKASCGRATGTLIDPCTVLTAGHAVLRNGEAVSFEYFDPKANKIISLGGIAELSPNFKYERTKNNKVKTIHFDLALIHLEMAIKSIPAATIDYGEITLPTPFISCGYGRSADALKRQLQLDFEKRAYTNLITKAFKSTWCDDCYMAHFEPLGDKNTTPLEGLGAKGDSGSPAFLESNEKLLLFGIVHLLVGNGNYDSYNLILPLKPYRDWIESRRNKPFYTKGGEKP